MSRPACVDRERESLRASGLLAPMRRYAGACTRPGTIRLFDPSPCDHLAALGTRRLLSQLTAHVPRPGHERTACPWLRSIRRSRDSCDRRRATPVTPVARSVRPVRSSIHAGKMARHAAGRRGTVGCSACAGQRLGGNGFGPKGLSIGLSRSSLPRFNAFSPVWPHGLSALPESRDSLPFRRASELTRARCRAAVVWHQHRRLG